MGVKKYIKKKQQRRILIVSIFTIPSWADNVLRVRTTDFTTVF